MKYKLVLLNDSNIVEVVAPENLNREQAIQYLKDLVEEEFIKKGENVRYYKIVRVREPRNEEDPLQKLKKELESIKLLLADKNNYIERLQQELNECHGALTKFHSLKLEKEQGMVELLEENRALKDELTRLAIETINSTSLNYQELIKITRRELCK